MAHTLAPKARADLDGIWTYIAIESGSDTLADRQIDAITARFHLIAEHPRIGRARDEDLGPGTRSFVADDYVIVYDIDGTDLRILRVAHGRRDLVALFGWRDE
jgi:plasmid stabilization system protein ParE